MDLWGNVSLSRFAAPTDHVGWQDVPPDPSLEKYSSLIGIPTRGLSPDTNTSYTLETSYFDLDCSKIVNGSTAECGNSTSTNTTKPKFYCFPGSTFSFGIDEMLVLACLVMFVVACIGALLNWRTEAPDILGYVSTMTRDSPHVSVSEGGSALDGIDRARLLKELRVQIQDVRPHDGVGYLAVASVEGPAKLPVADRMYQ
ncbi:hypothetical protein B0T25DRAFT_514332 [Lasiosphaeria hispida]|uniref:Uncharacterized protein n=1 Tax=Lasiosphaeria hispida TaxID=260671 RepID=A0AAJ0HY07_9PEZI|nr:hypothetical protein B0T25DRAFT_514332 [Lasiosphaeria hispida]